MNATIDCYVKSALKLQNTSTINLAGEADDVDNVPISGKSYSGTGNGTLSNRYGRTEATFVCNNQNGMFVRTGTIASGLAEMPPPGYFRNVKATASQRINPGRIKFSTLVHRTVLPLNSLLKHVTSTHVDGAAGSGKGFCRIGKFQFFGFEHVLKATSGVNIKVNAEHNYRIAAMISLKGTYNTDEKVTNEFITYP